MRIKQMFKIDPLKSFTQLPLFWIILTLSLLLSSSITYIIIRKSNLIWNWDYIGFNFLIEIFKVPFSIMAIALTIVAILATMHRSAQTKEQILNSNKQNAFSNYYKHIEEFEKYMNTTIKSNSLNFGNLRFTHRMLFPNSFQGIYNVDGSYLELVEDEYSKIKDLLQKFNQDREETVLKLLIQINKSIDYCFAMLDIKVSRSGTQYFEEGEKLVVPSYNIFEIIKQIKEISFILGQILSFDHEVSLPISLLKVYNLSTSDPPKWDLNSKYKFENFIHFN